MLQMYEKFIDIECNDPRSMHLYVEFISELEDINIYEQDAREAMRVVFFCTYKMYLYAQNYFLKNIFKYCFKSYIKLHEYANCNSANYDV